MADTGWIKPGTGQTVNTDGPLWANPSNITVDDGSRSIASSLDDNISDQLWGTNYSFDAIIAADKIIDGVEFRFNRRNDVGASTGVLSDYTIQLIVGGAVTGDNKASGASWPTSATTSSSYGGATDTWGLSPTAEQVRASDFGVEIQVQSTDGNKSVDADAYFFEMKVYYSDAPSGWTGIVNGVTNPGKVNGVSVSNIDNVMGVN